RAFCLRRQDRLHRPLGERAVADVAPGGRAEATNLAERERREVVVQQEVTVEIALDGLDLLLVGLRAERGGNERLGLAACEHARAVRSRQVGHVDRDRAEFVGLAAVDTDAALDDEPPYRG